MDPERNQYRTEKLGYVKLSNLSVVVWGSFRYQIRSIGGGGDEATSFSLLLPIPTFHRLGTCAV